MSRTENGLGSGRTVRTEYLVLGGFCACLTLCVALDFSVIYALLFGLFLFLLYGRRKGFAWRDLVRAALSGIRTVRNILILFFLIGIMTALWRAAGTIPFIVSHAAKLIRPPVFLLMTFLLNCGMSVMTGTAFGTAATMGIICSAMGASAQVSPLLTGGAVLSGAYFGDRCSPASSSALLVATVTGTDIYGNIRRMVRNAAVPFILTSLIYLALGFLTPKGNAVLNPGTLYGRIFRLSGITVLPAAVLLLLSAFRVNIKAAMAASILTAVPICLYVQGVSLPEVFRAATAGFWPEDPEAAALIGGGGIVSMLRVACIVCISSAYAGIFDLTGLLDEARRAVSGISCRTTVFAAVLLSAVFTCVIACSQALAVILTCQLCRDLYPEKEQLAADIEDTAVVIAPLVPWSIAGAAPLAAAGVPGTSLLAAFYLVLLPLWRLLASAVEKRRPGARNGQAANIAGMS